MNSEMFKPALDRTHKYAVALKMVGNDCSSIESYVSEEQLEEGFREFYNFAIRKELYGPLAIGKADGNSEWSDAQYFTMSELMIKVMNREDEKRKNEGF